MLQRITTTRYESNPFFAVIKSILGLFFSAVFAKSLAVLLGALVGEKENGTRALMRAMGLSNLALAASWYATSRY